MLRTRINITGVVNGGGVITHYWGATEDAAGVTAVRAALSTWLTAIKPWYLPGVTYSLSTDVDIVDAATGNLTGLLPAASLSVAGTAAGEALPNSIQMLVRWRTGQYVVSTGPKPRSHEVRGRTFLAGGSETQSTGGVPDPATVTSITSASQTLANDTTAHLNVYSPAHGQSWQVATASCWSRYAILRSRRD